MSESKYAAIETASINHEGDERSRTHPGHGYPAWTEHVTRFVPFKDRAEMERYVARQSDPSKAKIIQYQDLKVVTKTTVEISQP